MMKIWDLINQYFEEKKFHKWKEELMGTTESD